jgi:enterochelin esterase family protein
MTHRPGTDLWYRTERVRRDARFGYVFSPDDPLIPMSEIKDIRAMLTRWQPDPLNPRTFVHVEREDDPTSYDLTWSLLEMPDAAPQPYADPRPDVPAGMVDRHTFTSRILNNERVVWVYTPAGYDPAGRPHALFVVFDGGAYLRSVRTDAILDNLLAEERIPPLVCVLINNVTIDSRSTELPCNEGFAEFLVTELLPWVAERYRITDDPAHTVVAGSSLGGLAAMYAGYRHPERFGKILSQSGSFRWRPGGAEGDEEPGWIIRRFVESPRLPLDICMDVGVLDRLRGTPDDPALLDLNRHLRDVLLAKGYPLQYVEFTGGHDYAWWRGTLADGLIYLLGAPSETGCHCSQPVS